MEREKLVELRDGLDELVDLINEILLVEEDEDKNLIEQKTAMFIYKVMLLSKKIK